MWELHLIFDDAYVGIHDDRLLRDDVCGSIQLCLGFVYSRGIVELLWIRSLMCLLVEQIIPKVEYAFVVLRLYMMLNEVDVIVMQRFSVSIVNEILRCRTSGVIFGR